MSEIKLLPCPFCGGEARMQDEPIEKGEFLYSVLCENDCVTQGIYHNTAESAIKAWNTRKPMERIVERLEEASLVLEVDYDFDEYDDEPVEVVFLNEAIEIVKEVINK